jgi:hypothetical protein
MLAMFLYNLILLFSLRELNRLYYLLYLLFINLVFLISNGLLSEYFQLGVHTGRILILVFICWRRGFRPARFFLIAFATLALSTMFEALLTFDILPYITEYSTQIASAAFELSTRKKR